jgi:ribonuclease MRP protein subunit RMP1
MAISISTSTTTTMAPASTITAAALLAAPAHDIAKLHDIHELLNKIFTRNKNQHRRSHWWKSLHAFRKQMGLLLHDLETKGSKKKEEDLQARLRFWDEGCVHMWY